MAGTYTECCSILTGWPSGEGQDPGGSLVLVAQGKPICVFIVNFICIEKKLFHYLVKIIQPLKDS